MEHLDFRKDYFAKLGADTALVLISKSGQDRNELLTDVEATAVSIICGHVEDRYQLEALFSPRYKKSRLQVKQWAVDLACYLMYERIGVAEPEDIKKAYQDTLKKLRSIKEGAYFDAPQRVHRGQELLNDDIESGIDEEFLGFLEF